MKAALGTLDRVTLAAWRFINEAGWPALAFLVATGAHLGITIWVQSRMVFTSEAFNLNARAGAEDGIDDLLAKFGLRIGLTIALAALIGGVVGRRVWRRQPVYAALGAAGYVLYTLVWVEHSVSGTNVFIEYPSGAEQHLVRRTSFLPALLYDLVVAATIPAAAWVAHRVRGRRADLPSILAG